MTAYIYSGDAGESLVRDTKRRPGIRPRPGITRAVEVLSSETLPLGIIVTVPIARLTRVADSGTV